MRILLYENRKTDPITWDCSTPEARAFAYLELFKILRDWGCYSEVGDESKIQQMLYQKAVAGDAGAAVLLLKQRAREGYEYEFCEEVEVKSQDR